ncbi:hypothetical protein IB260_00210 [Pseudomonas sp. PDM23]|uniref:hypothetical protein n=1 Tax=unclassified Pseudomonas TaxID=196821 RepID=UPI001784661D|nr:MULTISPECIES: hypothetical protein [unclassified Pseudomonas]MBD9573718.1 hypothetical protein [Pseudomonas sp. PDM23]MBD9671555.1 hypothetical protein [Pseudomonas sp. PDM21]
MTMLLNPYAFGGGGSSGFPELRAKAKSSSASTMSASFSLPTYSTNDLLIAVLCVRSTASVASMPSGWVSLGSQSQGSNTKCQAFYKIADGSEGSSVTVTFSVTTAVSGIISSIKNGTFNAAVAPEIAFANALTNAPNPPALTPSSGSAKYMVIASYVCRGDMQPTAYPYADGDFIQSQGTTGIAGTIGLTAICYGTFQAASVDPSTFTTNAGANNFGTVMVTMSVKGP